MAEKVRDIKDWLDSLDDDDLVGIAEGCLSIQVSGDPSSYYEIGALSEDDPGEEEEE